MSLRSLSGAIAALTVTACAGTSFPGMGARTASEPVETAPQPSVTAEPAPTARSGIEGAALCLASAEYLLNAGGVQEADGVAVVWNSILDVVPGEEAVKTGATRDIYNRFATMDAADGEAQGMNAAVATYDAACADREAQRAYLRKFGDPELMQQRIAEDENGGS